MYEYGLLYYESGAGEGFLSASGWHFISDEGKECLAGYSVVKALNELGKHGWVLSMKDDDDYILIREII